MTLSYVVHNNNVQSINTENAVGSRLEKIKELIHTKHMNNKETIFELCEQYTEIFYLD